MSTRLRFREVEHKRPAAFLAVVEGVQDVGEDVVGGDDIEERQGGADFQGVDVAEDVDSRLVLVLKECGANHSETRGERLVVEVFLSLLEVGDAIELRHRAMSQRLQLWEDVPYPVASLSAVGYLAEGVVEARVGVVLSIEEAGDVVVHC